MSIRYLYTFPKDGEKKEPARVGQLPVKLEAGDIVDFGTVETGAYLHRVVSVVWVGPVAKSVADLNPDQPPQQRSGFDAIVAVTRR